MTNDDKTFDMTAYCMAKAGSRREVYINGENTTYTDDGEGNVTISVSEEAND